MSGADHIFVDRHDAGRRLAIALAPFASSRSLILALPRGGVPVAFEIAKAFGAQLDIILVRKIGAPHNPEYGIGAVAYGDGVFTFIQDEAVRELAIPSAYVEARKADLLAEIERQRQLYLGDREAVPTRGREVVLVDDGIATGSSVRAALNAVHASGASRIVLAVPVAPKSAVAALRGEVDELVCLASPGNFQAVGLYYSDFRQTTDNEVIGLLREAAAQGSEERQGDPHGG
jgi:putative phosphoribosyl transferase